MQTFSVNFKAGNLDLDALVTASDNNHRFKVEMVTGEPDPIILRCDESNNWRIENPGSRSIPQQGITALCNAIDTYMAKQA